MAAAATSRLQTIYTDLPPSSRRVANVPFLSSANLHRPPIVMSHGAPMHQNRANMVRPSRVITMPVVTRGPRVQIPSLSVTTSLAPQSHTSSSSSRSSRSNSALLEDQLRRVGVHNGLRRNVSAVSYADAASSPRPSRAAPPTASVSSPESTKDTNNKVINAAAALEQRNARARAVAVLLLNRSSARCPRRRTFFSGQRQYVGSGLKEELIPSPSVFEESELSALGAEIEAVCPPVRA